MGEGIKRRVALAARRAGLSLIALVLAGVGLAFVTAAVWLALAASLGAILASTVVGLTYLGLAAIAVAFALGSSGPAAPPPPPPTPEPSLMQAIVSAFILGLEAGRNRK